MKNNNGKIGNCTNKKRKERGTKIAKEMQKQLNMSGFFIKSDKDKDLFKDYLFLVFCGDLTIDEAIALISDIMLMRESKIKKKVDFYNNFKC
ncbi:MAG: hypothetical protein RPS47_13830 [Colwellia sp.]